MTCSWKVDSRAQSFCLHYELSLLTLPSDLVLQLLCKTDGYPTLVFCGAQNLLPVCGTDNKTYDNACLAKCAKTPIKRDGACEGDKAKAVGKLSAP